MFNKQFKGKTDTIFLKVTLVPLFTGLVAFCLLLGCAFQKGSLTVSNVISVHGLVSSAGKPIKGSHVQLYEAGTSGSASGSNVQIGDDVISDASGAFSLSYSYKCSDPNGLVYLIARGGEPKIYPVVNNPAIMLIAALGPCNNVNTQHLASVNEITTVGSIWPLAPYAKSTTDITPEGDIVGFDLAVENVKRLINIAEGRAPGIPLTSGEIVPVEKLNTLANIISTCVQSSGGKAGDGTPCGQLFSLASSPSATNTLAAATAIALNPDQNVSDIFRVSPEIGAFQPALLSSPADWIISILSLPLTPKILPASGTYASAQFVTISDETPGVNIYYTIDGTAPTTSSTRYSSPFTVSQSKIVKAVAYKSVLRSGTASNSLKIIPPVSLIMTPNSVTLGSSLTQKFSAVVENATNTAVTWTMNPSVGSISASGVYTAPGWIANAQIVVVTATSVSDKTKSAIALVTLQPLEGTSEQAQGALRFIDSMGVNTHFGYIDTGYGNASFIASEVEKLGLKHVRDGTALVANSFNYPAAYAAMLHMGGTGVRFAAGNGVRSPSNPYVLTFPVSAFQAAINAMTVNGTDYLEAFEGMNEIDISGDQNWLADWTTNQNNLIAGNTMNMPIFSVSLAFSSNFPNKIPVQNQNAKMPIYGNIHTYAGNAMPGVVWPKQLNDIRSSFPSPFPIVATEAGYYDAVASGTGYVDEFTQAKYIPRTYLENFRAGIYRTYIYELMDEISSWNTALQETRGPKTCEQCSYGMITASGTEKQSFTAVKNMVSILNSGATSSPLSALTYSIVGGNANLHHVLLQKAPGLFDLILWQEISSFNTTTSAAIKNSTLPITLAVDATSVSTYNPAVSTLPTVQTMVGYNVVLQVPDQALVVEIKTGPKIKN